MADDLQQLWERVLSRDAERIRAAWRTLTAAEQTAVRAHLVRMVTESGWSEPQRFSAQTALDVLDAPPGTIP